MILRSLTATGVTIGPVLARPLTAVGATTCRGWIAHIGTPKESSSGTILDPVSRMTEIPNSLFGFSGCRKPHVYAESILRIYGFRVERSPALCQGSQVLTSRSGLAIS